MGLILAIQVRKNLLMAEKGGHGEFIPLFARQLWRLYMDMDYFRSAALIAKKYGLKDELKEAGKKVLDAARGKHWPEPILDEMKKEFGLCGSS